MGLCRRRHLPSTATGLLLIASPAASTSLYTLSFERISKRVQTTQDGVPTTSYPSEAPPPYAGNKI
ncbi:hypothetical protein CY34DRAFT_800367 [Suillus luteus UH-Slu-Lm8-n1]|uniref:Uncharacterized protein n=1 Tax=Suillus luteus UH-Slu-Lm8-n1 TaxID=930992 RepID=A0A0D0A8S7_9AGAM|nr:hypothetical protein CY34DRAFT_800367 [Suillus luteus UH-Slu-Lm8-n1]